MKYVLSSGGHGIIKTLEEVLYIANVKQNQVTCLTRNHEIISLHIDCSEYMFKKALIERNYNEVQYIIEQGQLRGESIISYLQKKKVFLKLH